MSADARVNALAVDGAFRGILGHWEMNECGTETLRHRGEGALEIELLVGRILGLLQDRAVMRKWDLARAARAEKVGFWADIAGYFFIFVAGGGARARGRAGQVAESAGGGVAAAVLLAA